MISRKNLFLSLLVAGVFFTGCGQKPKISVAAPPEISFNISNAEALGGINSEASRSASREAEDNSQFSLQKIMEDGTLESALACTIPGIEEFEGYQGFEGEKQLQKNKEFEEESKAITHWANLFEILIPPKVSNRSEVYLLFDSTTTIPGEHPDYYGMLYEWSIGNVICINPDNTWTDVIVDDHWVRHNDLIDNKRNVQFADDGSLYVLYRDNTGWENYLIKYDPAAKKTILVCELGQEGPSAEVYETWTEEQKRDAEIIVMDMKVTKDAKYICVRMSTYYKDLLRVISLEDVNNYRDIVLGERDTESQFGVWGLDVYTDTIYYKKAKQDTIYSVPCDGSEDEKEIGTIDYCNALISMGKDKVCGTYYQQSGENTYEIAFVDVHDGSKMTITLADDAAICVDDYYLVTDDAVYACFYYGDEEGEGINYVRSRNDIYRLSISDGEYIDYMDYIEEGNNITIYSWDVGESKICFSGVSNGKPATYIMNLDGTNVQKVAGNQAFTCIGSLK